MEESNVVVPEKKEKPKVELLAKLFANFPNPPRIGENRYFLGSKNFTKIIMFAIDVQLNNDDINFWSHQKPQRQEQEVYEAYKQRMKFTKLLDKFRPYLFDYNEHINIMGGKKYSTKRAKKIKKQLGI